MKLFHTAQYVVLELAPVLPFTAQRIDNRNRGIDFDQPPLKNCRPIAPLADGIHRRSHQFLGPRNVFQLLNSPVFGDDCVQNNGAGNPSFLGFVWIFGLDLVDHLRGSNFTSNANSVGKHRRRRFLCRWIEERRKTRNRGRRLLGPHAWTGEKSQRKPDSEECDFHAYRGLGLSVGYAR